MARDFSKGRRELSRILITGVAGFVGSRLAKDLLAQGHSVVGIDIVPREHATRIKDLSAIEYHWQSLQDLEGIYGAVSIIHTAAVTDVPFSIPNPTTTIQQNVVGTMKLLDAARREWGARRDYGESRIIIQSSESVYGSTTRVPIPEDTPLRPSNIYGASKAAAEMVVWSYHYSHGLPTVILRSSSLFGPDMRMTQVTPIFLRQALKGQPITVHGAGDQTRDFNYVDNLIDGIFRALQKAPAGSVFNLAGDNEISVTALAEKCIEVMGSSSEIIHTPQRAGETGVRLAPDITAARQALGYSPEVSFDEGLARTADWIRELVGTRGVAVGD